MSKIDPAARAKQRTIVYSTQKIGLEKQQGVFFANPRFFSSPRQDVTRVQIVGDYPVIEAAYKKMGIPVERIGANGQKSKPVQGAPQQVVSDPGKVNIPLGWEKLNWQALRALAKQLGKTVINKEDALAAVKAEVDRRSAAQ